MELDMKMKKKLTEETAKWLLLQEKKQKTKILDEFVATIKYNRKYAIHILKNSAYVKVTHTLTTLPKKVCESLKRHEKAKLWKILYGQELWRKGKSSAVWIFDVLVFRRLVPFIRDNIDYFVLKVRLFWTTWSKTRSHIKFATVGRILKRKSKTLSEVFQQHGLQRILISSFNLLFRLGWTQTGSFFWELACRKLRYNARTVLFCTLTLTDVHSGWTENRALLNKAPMGKKSDRGCENKLTVSDERYW